MFGGIVIDGDKLGKTYGFPTANLDSTKKDVKFQPGIYAGWCKLNKKRYTMALIIREEPVWKVEVYLLDYDGPDFYGSYLQVEPVQQVASIAKFVSSKDLIKKIKRDISLVEEWLLTVKSPKILDS